MATIFTPTKAPDLRAGDYLGTYPERVLRDPVKCREHGGDSVYFEVVSDDGRAHSDVCVSSDHTFVVRSKH